jgi:hypothetical protein
MGLQAQGLAYVGGAVGDSLALPRAKPSTRLPLAPGSSPDLVPGHSFVAKPCGDEQTLVPRRSAPRGNLMPRDARAGACAARPRHEGWAWTRGSPRGRLAVNLMSVQRPFPRRTIDQALRVPQALKDNNGGNPWPPAQVADAIAVGKKTANFFYITTSSRDFGFTEGTRDTAEISLTDLGKKAVYPQSPEEEKQARLEGFLRIDSFRKVLEHYGGNNLPERRFLENTLHQEYGIDPTIQDEFVELFEKNCRLLGIGKEWSPGGQVTTTTRSTPQAPTAEAVTVGTPAAGDDAPVCFVIMPFGEKEDRHDTGFFAEVLRYLFTPAATAAGFRVQTAQRQGSDVIQSTIVNDLLEADLVLADLTEHNPNVLFELGVRMHEDKPVALVRAKGTGQIFDVDNMLRVQDYNPNLWPSTVEKDVPRLTDHIKAAWENRDSADTFMKILLRGGK